MWLEILSQGESGGGGGAPLGGRQGGQTVVQGAGTGPNQMWASGQRFSGLGELG